MGYRDNGYGSRGRRDRRPSPPSWSSAAEFGDPTIDRPTPLTARRDRAAAEVERAPERSELPAQRAEEFDTAGREPYDEVGQASPQFADRSGRRAASDRDEAEWRRDHPGDATRPESDPGSWGGYGSEPTSAPDYGSWSDHRDEPARPYESRSRHAYDDPPQAEDEPRHSRHSVEESPRRSLRALEEAARRAREESTQRAGDDQPWRTYEEGPGGPSAFSDPVTQPAWSNPEPPSPPAWGSPEPLGRADWSSAEPLSQPGWSSPEPYSRHYRDDTAETGSWRTRQRTEVETWRTEDASAQRWRSETISWRTHETIEVDTGRVDRLGTRAIGSAESGTSTSTRSGYTDPADLEAWRSETGTWRTSDTAATGSWRLSPTTDDVPPVDGGADGWGASTAPETGLWSRSQGRWVPAGDDSGEQANFVVRRYDDTGELPKELLRSARGRVLDHDEFYDASRPGADGEDRGDGPDRRRGYGLDWRRDDDGERRVGRRRADDSFDEAPGYDPGYRSDDRMGRSYGRFGDGSDDDRQSRSGWSETGVRRSRRALPAPDDLDGGYPVRDEEPGWRSRSSRYDDDAPRNRSGRRSAGGPRTARHSLDEYDEEDRRRPTRAVARRTPAYAGSRGVAESVITPRNTGRGELVPVGRRVAVADEDDDDVEEAPYGYAGAGLASVAWFGLPIGAFLLWAMFLGGTARADCVNAAGRQCAAPRDAAFATFATHLPQIGVAIVLSVVVGLLIRLVSPFWRPATVGFAASVVGGGVTTVLFTVLNS